MSLAMEQEQSKHHGRFTEAHFGQRVDQLLPLLHPELSRARAQKLIQAGHLLVAGKPVTQVSHVIRSEQDYALTIPEAAPLNVAPEDIPLTIVHEDDALIVIDKPAGMVVHPAAGHESGTLVNALLHHCKGSLSGIGGVARPGIVHRIDKDTSGLLVIAKTDAAHQALAEQFADHSISRNYAAIVVGQPIPPKGTVTGNIGRSPHDRKKMAIVGEGKGKHAVTHYELLRPLKGASLLRCTLDTGRTHQIRVHMASKGHPLLGDPVYGRIGGKINTLLKNINFTRQALHAETLGFIHPVSQKSAQFSSEYPADFKELLTQLSVK
ncbi:RluA family pseudouridine synthase [Alterisphingorhabdus coralli]|uniref:Pseudouridine synthase n=1 Tax=Alterisphingorhabdus coralli TaxID=3071408 RepID=A0AA97FB89_9SPHN|nr:RluA family pseudouridine synthase [Parasphingorhabdus sp. SCSIO 66989]WOE76452.1 RluA family pseudouridine synthase [Parasphingorhabdus sp. SCSIO 66989]